MPRKIAISHAHVDYSISYVKIRTMATSSEKKEKLSPNSVVELLCLKVHEEKITVEKGGTVKQVTINHNNKDSDITFAGKYGRTNGLNHLKS